MTRGCEWFALLALAGGCSADPGPRPEDDGYPDYECQREVRSDFTVDLPAPPPVELRAESCRRDVDACRAFCEYVLEEDAPAFSEKPCRVEFAESEIRIAVEYTRWCP